MSFTVEVEHRIKVVQGLASPVRARRGLPLVPAGEGVPVLVTVGIAFADDQLDERGRFVDTDAVEEELASACTELEERPWVEQFPSRPTFEVVARHLFGRLARRVPQVAFVQLRDEKFGTNTRYEREG
ncbi:hypothetical protein ACQP2F_35315 [Actinoplanes sp. CA-030573]|uniref:hypothetical protein n=1 Tax=Actinoplanes sp. CA-030573 TaxID=3239898 RepID=UPI003D8DFA85